MPTPKTNDAALLALLQSDPQAGLARLLDAYGGLIHGVVRRILPRNPEDAEECVADVLVAAWQSAGRLAGEPDRPLQGWLTLTARHIAIDRYRALRRQNTLSLDDGLGETLADLNAFDRLGSEAEALAGALVAGMDQPDREIFLRKYYLLQPTKEIAAALNMTVSAVNTRLSRGRDRLRRQLEEKGVHRHV